MVVLDYVKSYAVMVLGNKPILLCWFIGKEWLCKVSLIVMGIVPWQQNIIMAFNSKGHFI